jgi:hypothetical protein
MTALYQEDDGGVRVWGFDKITELGTQVPSPA